MIKEQCIRCEKEIRKETLKDEIVFLKYLLEYPDCSKESVIKTRIKELGDKK
jgi:hypothetical protein